MLKIDKACSKFKERLIKEMECCDELIAKSEADDSLTSDEKFALKQRQRFDKVKYKLLLDFFISDFELESEATHA